MRTYTANNQTLKFVGQSYYGEMFLNDEHIGHYGIDSVDVVWAELYDEDATVRIGEVTDDNFYSFAKKLLTETNSNWMFDEDRMMVW